MIEKHRSRARLNPADSRRAPRPTSNTTNTTNASRPTSNTSNTSNTPSAPLRSLGVGVMIALILTVFTPLAAQAAVGTLSSLTLSTTSDGTAPFDASAGPGADTGANNGIIRTHDTISYRWDYVVSTPGDITISQTLTGGAFTAAAVVSCAEGAAAITNGGQTINCTLTNRSVGPGSYQVSATISGKNAHGTTLSTTASTPSITSGTQSVTVSATPKTSVNFSTSGTPNPAQGPGSLSAQAGYTFTDNVDLFSVIDPASGIRGIEALGNTLTATITPTLAAAGYALAGCSAGSSTAKAPGPSGGSDTVQTKVRNSGTWSCTQPGGPGTPITLTVTGADSSLDSYPLYGEFANTLPAQAYFAVGKVQWWAPQTNYPAGTTTLVQSRLSGFDPNSISGASNFGSGYAQYQDPAYAGCTIGVTVQDTGNCSQASVARVQQPFSTLSTEIRTSVGVSAAPTGATSTGSGDAPILPGGSFAIAYIVSNPPTNSPMTNTATCIRWDPALFEFDPAAGSISNRAGSIIEYGTTAYANNDQRRSSNCGYSGDGTSTGWVSSVAAAGGVQNITGIRLTFPDGLPAGGFINGQTGVKRTLTPLPPGTPLPVFASVRADETPVQLSTYNENTHTGQNGGRVLAATATVRTAISWAAPDASPATTQQINLNTVVTSTGGDTATATTVRVQLPTPCISYVPGSSGLPTSTVTAPNLGADGIACTPDDGLGALIELQLGTLAAGSYANAFAVTFNPLTPVPTSQTVSAVVSSPQDPTTAAKRTTSSSIQVNALGELTASKTASTATVSNNVPYEYTVSWSNRFATGAGRTVVVDVLPFPGDGRGTAGITGITLQTVQPLSGVSVEYSTLDPATALSLLATTPGGDLPAFAWSSTKPTNPTAVRFIDLDLQSSEIGVAKVTVLPTGVTYPGRVTNSLSMRSDGLNLNVPTIGTVTLPTVGTPAFTATSSVTPPPLFTPSATATFSTVITNTGNTTLTTSSVTFPQVTGTGTPEATSCTPLIIQPGLTGTCTTAYKITQADINAGQVSATTTVSMTAPDAPDAPPPAQTTPAVTVTIPRAPALNGTLSTPSATLPPVGQIVAFTLSGSNTGNVTLNALTPAFTAFNGADPAPAFTCSSTQLAPGAAYSCTASYRITQADIDRGTLTASASASASASGLGTVTSTVSAVALTASQTRSIEILTSLDPSVVAAAGEQATLTARIKNSGTVTLVNPLVSFSVYGGDAPTPGFQCPGVTIAPGAAMDCTAQVQPNQANADSGTLPLRATVTAYTLLGESVTALSAPTPLTIDHLPALSATLVGDPVDITAPGQTVTYTATLTNSGNIRLNTFAITLENLNGTGSPPTFTCPTGVLNPGESLDCVASYVTTQPDVDTERVNLTIRATALDADNETITAFASASIRATEAPAMALSATITPSSASEAQTPTTITVRVSNTGNLTLTGTSVTVASLSGSNPQPTFTCPTTPLAPGAFADCTGVYEITLDDLDAGGYSIILQATAQQPNGTTVTTQPELARFSSIRLPAVTANVYATPGTATAAGEAIEFMITGLNSGNVTLKNPRLRISSFEGSALPPQLSCPPDRNAPGESFTCFGDYILTQEDVDRGFIRLGATASAIAPDGNTVTSAVALDEVTIASEPGLSATTQVNPATVSAAEETVSITTVVTNTGNVTLSNLGMQGSAVGETTPGFTCTPTTIAPGQQGLCTASYSITVADMDAGSVTLGGIARADAPDGTTALSTASTAVVSALQTAKLSVRMESNPPVMRQAGEQIQLTIDVHNDGNVTLSALSATRTLSAAAGVAPNFTCAGATLPPAATTSCSALYLVTQEDVDSGSVRFGATVRATTPNATTLTSAETQITVTTESRPGLRAIASAAPTSVYTAGTPLNITISLANNGNLSLGELAVNLDVFSGSGPAPTFSCTRSAIEPATATTCVGQYTVTADDILAGGLTLSVVGLGTATLTGETRSPSITLTIPVRFAPEVSLTLGTVQSNAERAGDQVTFTSRIANTGNTLLTGASVRLTAFTGTGTPPTLLCPPATLGVNETSECTATYTLTQDDVDAGSITLTGEANAVEPGGGEVTSTPSSAVFGIAERLALTATGAATPATDVAAGTTVRFQVSVRNTGTGTVFGLGITVASFSGRGTTPAFSCDRTRLAPEEVAECSAEYRVLAADQLGRAGQSLVVEWFASALSASGATLTTPEQSITVGLLPPSPTPSPTPSPPSPTGSPAPSPTKTTPSTPASPTGTPHAGPGLIAHTGANTPLPLLIAAATTLLLGLALALRGMAAARGRPGRTARVGE